MPEIQITTNTLERLTLDARRHATHECCGLLAGRDSIITQALAATNVASHPSREYEIAPEELFRLMREIRAAGLDLLGIYHSHPASENKPSPRDIQRAYYPATAYFILSPRADALQAIRAFSIQNGRVTELEIQEV